MSSSAHTEPKFQYKYFGYIVGQEWLLRYGVLNGYRPNLDPATRDKNDIPIEDVDEVGSIISNALMGILAKSKVLLTSKLGTVLAYDGIPEYCIVLATNHPRDKLPYPPPGGYTKLKEILGDREPQWYLAFS